MNSLEPSDITYVNETVYHWFWRWLVTRKASSPHPLNLLAYIQLNIYEKASVNDENSIIYLNMYIIYLKKYSSNGVS